MAATRKKTIRIALDPDVHKLLTRAARECGMSRSAFIRQRLSFVLEQYRRHPKLRSAGGIRSDRKLDDQTADALSAAIASNRKRRLGRLTELRDPWAS